MAARKILRSKSTCIYLTSDQNTHAAAAANSPKALDIALEFDESDIWNVAPQQLPSSRETFSKTISESRSSSKRLPPKKFNHVSEQKPVQPAEPASLPVNIPDWSKISRHGCGGRRSGEDEDGEDDDGVDRIPPHEYLARRRGASFSVHEGIGRTLKGRDLSSVRNAIWKTVGFED